MSDTSRPFVVYKLGGSLLDWEGLPAALDWIKQRRPDASILVVVGGGETADLVRRWDRLFHLGEERSHWLALESLALNEQLLQTIWPELRAVRSLSQCVAAAAAEVPAIVCASCFVRWAERNAAPPLPHTWHVTTDSIAAWVAEIVQAAELSLLKSTNLPDGISIESAASAGLVDRYFPKAAARLPHVTWINLRMTPVADQLWIPHPESNGCRISTNL